MQIQKVSDDIDEKLDKHWINFKGEKWKQLRIFSKCLETYKDYQNLVHGIQKLKLKMARPKVLFQDLARNSIELVTRPETRSTREYWDVGVERGKSTKEVYGNRDAWPKKAEV